MTLYDFSFKRVTLALSCVIPLFSFCLGGSSVWAASENNPIEVEDGLPRIALTREILYQTLAAELALQRGHHKPGLSTLSHLAETTKDARFARRAVEASLLFNQADAAAKNADIWLTLNPKAETPLLVMTLTAVLAERWEQAEQYARQLLSVSAPSLLSSHIAQLGAQWLGSKHPKEAYVSFSTLIQPYLTENSARLVMARLALKAGDRDVALEKVESLLLQVNPTDEVFGLWVDILINPAEDESKRYLFVQKKIEQYLKNNPKSRPARFALARVYALSGAIHDAEKVYQDLAKNQNEDPAPFLALGLLQADRKAWDSARASLLQYLNQSPVQEEIMLMPTGQRLALQALAQIEEAQHRFEWAKKWLLQIREPGLHLEITKKIAELDARLGFLDEAINRLDTEALIQKERSHLSASHALNRAAINLLIDYKRPAQALVRLEMWLNEYPKDVQALYDLAMVSVRMGELNRVEQSLRKVLEIEPEHHQALNALGYHFADQNKNLDEAETLIKKALTQTPNDPFILDSLGWVFFRKGDLNQARTYLESAWKIKKDAEISAHWGELLWHQQDKNAAQSVWRYGLAIDAENVTLRETILRFDPELNYQMNGRFVAQWELIEKNQKDRVQGYFDIQRGAGRIFNATLTGFFGQTLLDVQQNHLESILKLRNGTVLRGNNLQSLLNELDDLPPIPLDSLTQIFLNPDVPVLGWDIEYLGKVFILKRNDLNQRIEIKIYPEIE